MTTSDVYYSISDASRLLGRSQHTLRSWDKNPKFPEDLRAPRNHRNERVYTPGLIERIREWIAENDFHPGAALPNYSPTEEERQAHLERLREAASKRGPMKNVIEGTEANVLAFVVMTGGATMAQISRSMGVRLPIIKSLVQSLIDSRQVELVDDQVRPIFEVLS